MLCSLPVYERQMMANRRKPEMFKLDNNITWYLKDEDSIHKKRQIIERSSGSLYYIFGYTLLRGEENGRIVGEG